MASEKQIKANRENSARSTGPRTEAGKARSRRNALKHGVYSQKLTTPDEGPDGLTRYERVYLDHYRPQTPFDEMEVLRLAGLGLRLDRYRRMEVEILEIHGFNQELDPGTETPGYAGAGWGFAHDCSKARSLPALSQVEQRTSRQFQVLKTELDKRLKPPQPVAAPSRVAPPALPLAEAPSQPECASP